MKKIKNTNNGKDGGTLVGKAHYDKDGKSLGGIKTIITDDNRPVEVEGGEVIINKHASKKHWRELSRINQSAGNGVPITEPHFKKGGNTEKSKFKSKVEERKQKVAKVMHEFKEGKLKSHGKKITKHKQAVAIALSEALRLKDGGAVYTITAKEIVDLNSINRLKDGGKLEKEIKAKTYKEWLALMRKDNNAHNENAHQDDVIPFWEWVSEMGAMYGFKPLKDASGDTIVVRTQDNPPNKKDVLEYVERMKKIYADEDGDIDENAEEIIAEDVAKEFNIDMISAYDYIDNSKLKNGGEINTNSNMRSLGDWLLNSQDGRKLLRKSKNLKEFEYNLKKELPINSPKGKVNKIDSNFDYEHLWKNTKYFFRDGGYIEPHKEVKTDLATVLNELNYGEYEQTVYLRLRNLSDEKMLDEIASISDDYQELEDAIQLKIDDYESEQSDIDSEIDEVNDGDLSKSKKATKEKELQKKYESIKDKIDLLEIQKKEKETLKDQFYVLDVDDDYVKEIIQKVGARLQTRQNINAGTDLFPEDANIKEFVKKAPTTNVSKIKKDLKLYDEDEDLELLFIMKKTDPKNFTPEMWELCKKIMSKK
jgi:hypothetical protein